ncbi:hypothetical protein KP79_PYT22041 [Mizuhopecten yessoensis]|uniref:Uncharacterized protein n=1 Tax=Mizuhopecten yessoensis TaxID=6573 RepID=A0A210PYS2_MIZYE|nr:hypothetical protein KP79_PYT22041 [Mizuhopecten yessoensis]
MSEEEPVEREATVSNESSANSLTTEDALSLFSSRLESVLKRQKFGIFKEIDAKLQAHDELVAENSKSDFKNQFQSNEKQVKFNSDRIVELKRAVALVEEGNRQCATEKLEACVAALGERNKIVKIADRHGWDTVGGYLDDPIADDAEDSVRLRRAEARAIRSRKVKGTGRTE